MLQCSRVFFLQRWKQPRMQQMDQAVKLFEENGVSA